jgi:hypothetical protein
LINYKMKGLDFSAPFFWHKFTSLSLSYAY